MLYRQQCAVQQPGSPMAWRGEIEMGVAKRQEVGGEGAQSNEQSCPKTKETWETLCLNAGGWTGRTRTLCGVWGKCCSGRTRQRRRTHPRWRSRRSLAPSVRGWGCGPGRRRRCWGRRARSLPGGETIPSVLCCCCVLFKIYFKDLSKQGFFFCQCTWSHPEVKGALCHL